MPVANVFCSAVTRAFTLVATGVIDPFEAAGDVFDVDPKGGRF
jgi:hypothetical protein